MTWTVRPAATTDAEGVRAIASSAWRDTYDGLLKAATIERFIDRAYAIDRLEERIARHTFLVVEGVDRLIAFADAIEETDRLALAAIYASPEARGQGAGTNLLEALQSRFPRLPIAADVLVGNRKGETFYERRGFTPRETLEAELFGEHVTERRWWLEPRARNHPPTSTGTDSEPRAARIAGAPDLETVTEIVARSFADDPVWGPAYGSAPGGGPRAVWRLEIEAAMRLGRTWLSAGDEAAAVWIPPGGSTFDPAETQAYLVFLAELLGATYDRVAALHARFEAAAPTEPHYYLSLLGTHPDHRGHGHGMRLLADTLARIDDERMPAYLESTNPANNARYEGVGFEIAGGFEGYTPGSVVTTMWRPARR